MKGDKKDVEKIRGGKKMRGREESENKKSEERCRRQDQWGGGGVKCWK
jgi:hypothetical protein